MVHCKGRVIDLLLYLTFPMSSKLGLVLIFVGSAQLFATFFSEC